MPSLRQRVDVASITVTVLELPNLRPGILATPTPARLY
jgi:hypothetical protein